MNIDKVFENANIVHDSKARRVLNTAPGKLADITINELESGVTIERLESLTVPVYQYGTQITIHGIFKDIPADLRVCGYKSIILNGNGSLGVRYVAIDAAKKRLLERASRYAESGTRWGVIIDSQGCEVHKVFHSTNKENDKLKCIDCYNSTPDTLYIGNKQAVSLLYGGYAVIINVGAIYESNLWSLIKELTGIASQAEYDIEVQKQKDEDAIRQAKYDAERKTEAEASKVKMQTALASFKPPDNWIKFNGVIDTVGTFARLTDRYSLNGIVLQVIKTAKRGGRLCANSKEFSDFVYIEWQPSHYKQANYRIDGWQITEPSSDPKVKPNCERSIVSLNTDTSISHNEKLNGIEVKFQVKPSDTILDQLRALGFHWSNKNFLWYSRYTPELWQQIQTQIQI